MKKILKMKRTKENGKSGFTIVELMIAVAILSVMSAAIFAAFIAMLNQSQLVQAKIKVRNDSRLGMDYLLSNLRMAKLNRDQGNAVDPILQYEDEFGALQDWPPPELVGTEFSEPVNSITFVRPLQSADGTPFVANSAEINWSAPITFQLDVDDANGDGRTNQLVQLYDGDFARVVIEDISPVINSGGGSIYDTPATGGIAFQGSANAGDESKVFVTLIQRRDVGLRENAVVMRYDSFVDVQN